MNALLKIIKKLKKEVKVEIPSVKKLGHLTSIEVQALAHAEEGIELFPLHLYKGTIEGNVSYDGEIPLMQKITSAYYKDSCPVHSQMYKFEEFVNRGYITENELKELQKKFDITTEKIPAIFIIAPTESKRKVIYEKDPLLLIKINENDWIPVHAWNHSNVLIKKLINLN